MASVERAVVVLVAMAVVHLSNAAVYKVGDSAGWTTIGNIDYRQWAAPKNFQLGDVIRKFFFIFSSSLHLYSFSVFGLGGSKTKDPAKHFIAK